MSKKPNVLVAALERILAPEQLDDLLYQLGGGKWNLPTLRSHKRMVRDRKILQDWDEGMSFDDLARIHRVTKRHLYRILERMKNERRAA